MDFPKQVGRILFINEPRQVQFRSSLKDKLS